MQYWNRANKVACGIFLAAFVAYGFLITYSYNYYSNRAAATKSQLLTEYHSKIITLTTDKISTLYADSGASPNDKVALSVLNHNLELCTVAKCARYNLLKLESSIKKIIPDFVNCRIELDKNLIYSNTKSTAYQLKEAHSLGKHMKINVDMSGKIMDKYPSNKGLKIRYKDINYY